MFTYLDLEKITLYGFESPKSKLVIEAIIKGIEAGDDFEEVHVFKINEKEYRIYWQGHCRAIGHYLAKRPLKCIIVNEDSPLHKNMKPIRIQDIELCGDKGEYQKAKEVFTKYR